MGLFRKLSGFLGFSREEGHEVRGVEANTNGNTAPPSGDVAAAAAAAQAQNIPRRGFSVPIQVPVERSQLGPILVRCSSRDGGVQPVMDLSFVFVRILENNEKEKYPTYEKGLRWYAKRLRIDEDGDVADEFLDEILRDTPSSTEEHHRQYPKFELKYTTKPAKVTSQALSAAGKIQHRVEQHQGKLEWI